MRIASLAEVKAGLSAFVDLCRTDGPVVITRRGKAVAVIVAPVDDNDLENILLTRSPRLQAMLAESRASLQNGEGLSEEQFWEAVEKAQ